MAQVESINQQIRWYENRGENDW